MQDNVDYTDYKAESSSFSISNDAPPMEPEIITDIKNDDLDSIEEIGLSNFPNPFATQTTIHFSLVNKSQVRMNIYDLQGKLITQLLNEQLHHGVHEKAWRNDGLLRGIYQVNLIVDDQIFTRKIVADP